MHFCYVQTGNIRIFLVYLRIMFYINVDCQRPSLCLYRMKKITSKFVFYKTSLRTFGCPHCFQRKLQKMIKKFAFYTCTRANILHGANIYVQFFSFSRQTSSLFYLFLSLYGPPYFSLSFPVGEIKLLIIFSTPKVLTIWEFFHHNVRANNAPEKAEEMRNHCCKINSVILKI